MHNKCCLQENGYANTEIKYRYYFTYIFQVLYENCYLTKYKHINKCVHVYEEKISCFISCFCDGCIIHHRQLKKSLMNFCLKKKIVVFLRFYKRHDTVKKHFCFREVHDPNLIFNLQN